MKREEPTNLLLFSLCATIFIHLQLKPREKAILKSDVTILQRNVRLNSSRNIYVMSSTIVCLIYHLWTIFKVENVAMKTPNSIWRPYHLVRRVMVITVILSSDWRHERAVWVCQVMSCPHGIARFRLVLHEKVWQLIYILRNVWGCFFSSFFKFFFAKKRIFQRMVLQYGNRKHRL